MTWYPIVRQKLEAEGHEVIMPQLPGRELPIAEQWLDELKSTLPAHTSDLHVVGHSLGTRAALILLEQTKIQIASLMLIGAMANTVDDHQSRDGIKTFFTKKIDNEQIKKQAGNITLLHGTDDDKVEYSQGQSLARELEANLITATGHKHFLGEDGAEVIFSQITEQLSAK